ncbi:MAG: hypothetical protein Q9161_007611 [Pseudevernia consocians]
MWQKDSGEADALRSQHGSSESRREMRRKLRTQSYLGNASFLAAILESNASAPPDDTLDEGIADVPMREILIPNFVIKHRKDSEYSRFYGRDFELVGAHTGVMRLNKQLHFETRDYLFRDSIIKIDVSEDGFSFLENKSGGNYISSTGVESGRFTGAGAVTSIRSIPRDRDAEWHQTFLANFDFTLPKRLIISIEAASHENPKEVILSPLATLRNASEVSVEFPPTTAVLGTISVMTDSICNHAKGKASRPVAKDIAENDYLTERCRQRLKDMEMRKKIKKAERTKAKD